MIILCSQSPRRKEIFNFFSLPFKQVNPDFDEDSIPFENNPADYVCQLAKGKTQSYTPGHPDDAIIAADTIVYKDGKVYGKPKNSEEAFRMLKELSGVRHIVYTGLALAHRGKTYCLSESTQVEFNCLTDSQITHYHNTIQWSDKAGAYGIQHGAGLIIKKIDGCFYNVMGLPVNTLQLLLQNIGIDLWDYLK
jgi:septum formation protein